MNSTLKTLLGVSAAIVLTGTAAGVLAQDGPPGAPPSVGFGQGGPGGGRGGPPSPEQRAEQLTQRLNLRQDQQAALQTFLQASAPPMGRGQLRAQRQMTTPERLDQQLAEMRQRVDATKRFYSQLTPEQKQVFDSTPMLAGPEGGPRGGRGGRRGPGGPGGGPNQGFGAPPQ